MQPRSAPVLMVREEEITNPHGLRSADEVKDPKRDTEKGQSEGKTGNERGRQQEVQEHSCRLKAGALQSGHQVCVGFFQCKEDCIVNTEYRTGDGENWTGTIASAGRDEKAGVIPSR